MAPSTVKVRIAPSPTGDPHVGTAYIALFNYAFARHHGGKFVLRIEDTDQARSSRQSEQAILRSLRWLGLEWDEGPDIGGPCGPYRQSERAAIYAEHARTLTERGRAYPCFCTPERLEALRESQRKAGQRPGYDGHCRDLPPAEVERLLQAGTPHVLRLRMPDSGETVVRDLLRGDIPYRNEEIDDQVLMKSDGLPTYHLANVVDDYLMGITHVIRAEEWIPSTPKHIVLYEAFGWPLPQFCHMPLLRNTDRSKISKRKNPTSLEYYRRAGFLPDALLNFLGLMGYSLGGDREKFSLGEMIETFDLQRISLGGPIFDMQKLEHLNGLYLRDKGPDALIDVLREEVFSRERLAAILPLVFERMRRLDEFVPLSDFFFAGAVPYDPAVLLAKGLDKAAAYAAARDLGEKLDAVVDWSEANIEAVMRQYAEANNWKAGKLFMLVRAIVTGRTAAPPLFQTMAVVGKAMCQYRFRQVLDVLRP